jgi:hypothetical protein
MTVSEQIIEVLNYICEKVGLAIDWSVVFASENVIPYIEQLCGKFITYEIATSVMWLVIGIILLIIAYISCKVALKEYKKQNEEGNGDESVFIISVIIAFFCIIGGILMIFEQTFDIITCVTFPEKMLVEEIMEIYNNMSN